MTLSAVLLVGGESRRMGRDKAQIIFEGEPLWQRQQRTLRELQPAEIFISARKPLAWHPADIPVLFDTPPSRGPLSGLTSAFEKMQTTHLLTLAVDMPFMTGAILRKLWRAVSLGRGILPMLAGRAEPLAAIYPREVAEDFAEAMRGANHALQSLVRALVEKERMEEMKFSGAESEFFRSVNDPASLRFRPGAIPNT